MDKLAIVSVACGALSFVFAYLFAPIAIITGVIGIRKTQDPRSKKLCWAGIALGAIALAMSLIVVLFFTTI